MDPFCQSRGFHYHYEVISPSAVSSGSPGLSESEPVVEPLRTEESRATFGYRKPSGEYRVVDYLAEGLGFNRKGVHSESGRTVRAQDQRQTTASTTTSTTTTMRPTPIYVPSTTPATDYDDDNDEDEEREGPPIPPPAPLRMGKTSPAQQARLLMHHDQSNGQTGKSDEQRKERLEDMRTSGIKGTSKKAKDNEIRQEKMDRSEPTTVRSPPPPPTTTTTTTTTSSTTTEASAALERESETVMARPSTGRIKGRLTEMSDVTSNEAEMEQPEKMMRMERENPQSKISIHQLISQAMPTLQMSVVPVYFMNKATRTVMAVPYLVMKSVSKMPLIPGMVDGLPASSMSGAQNLLSFAMNNKMQRTSSPRSPVPAMLTLSPSVAEKTSMPSMSRETESQVLEAGVEDARAEDSTGSETPPALSPSSTQSDNNWVTIDSPASAETLDNTWFKR